MTTDRTITASVGSELPEVGYAAAIAELPKLNHHRLRWLLGLEPEPSAVWTRIVQGHLPLMRSLPGGTMRAWVRAARAISPASTLARYQAAGVRVLVRGREGYPQRLLHDPEPPAVLFSLGNLTALDHPAVAVIGTRRASGYGRDCARRLGKRLAAEGVSVVSGLAVGIDLAAQRGALAAGGAPVVGVAGTGLDVVYPAQGREVWKALGGGSGVLVSEAPLGAPPSSWRFPDRNRIMAALADVVVVVESPRAGGSLSTVNAAAERGINVLAVPGPVTSAASAGTNALIADGCGIVCDAEDVLVAIGLAARTHVAAPADESAAEEEAQAEIDPRLRTVLDAVEFTPTPFDRVLTRLRLPASEVSVLLYDLEADGLVRQRDGCWERQAPDAGST